VSARLTEGGRMVALCVSDTGIGIDPDDHERIFYEFAQVEGPIQRRVRGTGLGLPLCRKLAALLGGTVTVSSRVGHGATFIAEIPVIYEAASTSVRLHTLDPARIPVLAIEDNVEQLLLFEKFVSGSHYQIVSTRSLRQAREALAQAHPRAILLDVLLRGEDTWEFLTDLKRSEQTRSIPVAVISSVEDRQKGLALGADEYCIKPIDRQALLQLLTRLVAPQTMKRILIVDDDAVARYILRRHLHAPQRVIEEASDGISAIASAVENPPDVICLDLSMPGITGYEVLRRLRQDPRTHAIPVLVISSMRIDDAERRALLPDVRGILSKDDLSEERVSSALEAAMRPAAAS
jgi:CheY-like chemotaxis protein